MVVGILSFDIFSSLVSLFCDQGFDGFVFLGSEVVYDGEPDYDEEAGPDEFVVIFFRDGDSWASFPPGGSPPPPGGPNKFYVVLALFVVFLLFMMFKRKGHFKGRNVKKNKGMGK